MAVGDQNDNVGRLRALLPRGWFAAASGTPFLTGILTGIADFLATSYAWLVYASQQLRLATAFGEFLDMICVDFLGTRIFRNVGETDSLFRTRVQREILRPKVTRTALIQELTDLTGYAPIVFEPARATDTGGYGVGCGYGLAGGYGSRRMPFQCLVTAYRPPVVGVPGIAGYNTPAGGYGVGAIEYISPSMQTGVTDQTIYDAIDGVLPVGTVAWVRLTNYPPTAGQLLDVNFILNESTLG